MRWPAVCLPVYHHRPWGYCRKTENKAVSVGTILSPLTSRGTWCSGDRSTGTYSHITLANSTGTVFCRLAVLWIRIRTDLLISGLAVSFPPTLSHLVILEVKTAAFQLVFWIRIRIQWPGSGSKSVFRMLTGCTWVPIYWKISTPPANVDWGKYGGKLKKSKNGKIWYKKDDKGISEDKRVK